MAAPKRVLSIFSLVMINVIAVDSLRTLPISAKLGFSLVSYYAIAALVFFVPVALVAAELATAYPSTGGIYIWIREAFGKRAAFMTIWLQWIYNIFWYPTIMAFVVATLAYLFDPNLANHKLYLLTTMIGFFWLFTYLNCQGMKTSSLISTMGACFGTIIPMLVIAILGFFWVIQGRPLAAHITDTAWLPDFTALGNLSLFTAVLFGLLGMEMSAVHAEEVKNPQRDYPRALLYSTLIIFSTLVLGSLAIVIVVPNPQLSMVSGLIDAYAIFFHAYHLDWLTPILAVLIVLGAISGISAWMIGPTKGLLVAAHDDCIPKRFTKTNKHGAPTSILVTQAIIFTLLTSVFVLFKTINAAYWILSDMCAQMALLVYVLMFAAAIKLRYKKPSQRGAYRIPGGMLGMWLVAGTGLVCSVITIFIGFVPPTQVPIKNVMLFESILVGGLVLFAVVPWLFKKQA
ncbi:MAG: APC family permease [Legionellaceae bacterium]|nr:APC family permease [Legionellaceae bacterium]